MNTPPPPHPIDRANDTYEEGWYDGYSKARIDLRAMQESLIDAALHSWTGVHVAPLSDGGYDQIIAATAEQECPDCATRTDASFHDPEAEPCHRCGDTGYILAAAEQESRRGLGITFDITGRPIAAEQGTEKG